MFWKFTSTCNINSLLEKADVTLQTIMDDDDVLQECKGQNPELIEFLCKPDIIEQLVNLIISEPAGEIQEPVKYKYSNTACEILVSDVAQLNDALGDTDSLREKLFSFLDDEPPLNPLLASFFSKVVGILLSRKPEPTLDFIKSKPDFVGSVLKHLGTSAIMDLLLRLITCVEAPNMRARVLSWLNDNRLVERLICLINPKHSEDFHFNSQQALCDIIRLSREHMFTMQESAQEDPLLNTLEKQETVESLLEQMFNHGVNESVIINGIGVLLALLEIRRPAPFGFPEMAPELTPLDVQRLAHGVSKTLKGLGKRLDDFKSLLSNPPQKESMNCTFGKLDPPLGNTRLHVVKLLSAILLTNTPNMNHQLAKLQIFNGLLDLFFRYEYNNFLHTQVVQCLHTVLTSGASSPSNNTVPPVQRLSMDEDSRKEEDEENPRKLTPLLTHIFEDCRLIQRILDAWNDNRNHEEKCGQRKGYMGHLTIVTNQIIDTMERSINSERIKAFIEGMPENDQDRWAHFVSESLAEVNEKNLRQLGGYDPKTACSDNEADYGRYDSSSQQAFNDYQLQQITSNFSDQFGFTESDYAENDDIDKFSKINQVDFDIKADNDSESRLQFEKYCTSEIPTIDDHIDDDDDDDDGNDIFENVDDDDDWHHANQESSIFENSANLVEGNRATSSNAADAQPDLVKIKQEEMDTTSAPPTDQEFKNEGCQQQQGTPHPNEDPWFDDNKVAASSSPVSDESNNWANFDDFKSETAILSQETGDDNSSSRAALYASSDVPMSESSDSFIAKSNKGEGVATVTAMEVQPLSATVALADSLVGDATPQNDVVMELVDATSSPSPAVSSTTTTNMAMDVDQSLSSAPIPTASQPAEAVQITEQETAAATGGASEQVALHPSSSIAHQSNPPTATTKDNKDANKEEEEKKEEEGGTGEPSITTTAAAEEGSKSCAVQNSSSDTAATEVGDQQQTPPSSSDETSTTSSSDV